MLPLWLIHLSAECCCEHKLLPLCPCRIKIHDLAEVKDVYSMINVEEEKGTIAGLQWTPDGQLLTVSTNQGTHVQQYLATSCVTL